MKILNSKNLKQIFLGLCLVFFVLLTTPQLTSANDPGVTNANIPQQGFAAPQAPLVQGNVADPTNNTGKGARQATEADIPESLGGIIYLIAVKVGGWFVQLGGGLLDYAIKHLVVEMGSYLQGSLGLVVEEMWGVIRDVLNIGFIFGLIYIGFQILLSADDTSYRKTIGLLIVAALLINFSLFFTRAIIDASNLAAYQVYTKMATPNTGGGSDADIALRFMNSYKITSYADKAILDKYQNESWYSRYIGGVWMTYGIFLFFLMMVTAFIFTAAAFMLIGRFVMLVLMMIFSSFMFLGLIFPYFKQYQDKWWGYLLKNAFMAPAMLFMFYISIFAVESLGISGATIAAGFGAEAFDNGAFAIFLQYFIVAGFLIASIYLAQEAGIYGASGALRLGSNIANGVRGSVQGIVGRNSLGLVARGGFNLNNWMERRRWGRNIKRGISVASLGAFTERDRQRLIKKGLDAKFGSQYSTQENMDWNNEGLQKRRDELQAGANKRENQRENKNNFSKAISVIDSSTTDINRFKEAVESLGKAIKQMSDDEVVGLGLSQLTTQPVAFHLSDTQIDNLAKSGKFTNKQVRAIKDARKAAFVSIATNGTVSKTDGAVPASVRAGGGAVVNYTREKRRLLMTRDSKELGKLPVSIFTNPNMAEFITVRAVENRMREGLNAVEMLNIRNNILTGLGVTPPAAGVALTDADWAAAGISHRNSNDWFRWYKRGDRGNLEAKFFFNPS